MLTEYTTHINYVLYIHSSNNYRIYSNKLWYIGTIPKLHMISINNERCFLITDWL